MKQQMVNFHSIMPFLIRESCDEGKAMTNTRNYGMDWLRILAFMTLTMYHINMYFVPWNWHVVREETSLLLVAPMIAVNPWRLILLFVVAGFASAAMIRKYSDQIAFIKERSARLLIPTLFAMIVLIPIQPWIDIRFNNGYAGSYWQFYIQEYWDFSWEWGMFLPTWQHLWFIWYLWAYTLIAAFFIMITSQNLRAKLSAQCDILLSGWRMLAVPAFFFALIILSVGLDSVMLDSWIRKLPAQPVYMASFFFGCYLFGAQKGWTAIRKYWIHAAIISIILIAYAISSRLIWNDDNQPLWASNLFALSRPVHAWLGTIALIGFADRFLNHNHKWLPMFNESVFPFYVIHKSIIVVVGYILLSYNFSMPIDYLILLLSTYILSWFYYRIGGSFDFIRPLIGLKRFNKLSDRNKKITTSKDQFRAA